MARKFLTIAVLFLLAGLAALYWYMRPLPILTVTSWAGAYGRAQAAAQMRPFASANRVDVHIAQWEGELSDLKGDVIDFELPKAVEACHRGLLEKIDAASLPDGDGGTPAARDFVPGAIGACWVGNNVYSQIIISGKFAGAAPATLADFFDRAKFPGKRALKRGSGKYNLEMALLADGIAPKDVYATLSTDLGLARALHKLDSLSPDLIWYDKDNESLALIQEGGAMFATALNIQLFDAAQHGAKPNVIWDRQLYEFDAFGIPAGDPKKNLAMDYIRFATGAKALAGVADWQPFGPARRSGLALVSENPETHVAMRDFMPTAHFDTAFAVDDEWWRDNSARVDRAWRNWLAAH
ncbi:MAG TPA: extracellular solute-binding protein [Rhizomicrobium sp.]|jgi:putative spermidine/putrescine transport system substrate-binding protein|nr:extracellular solute-binding protein [Rhizomicrobium sp.]